MPDTEPEEAAMKPDRPTLKESPTVGLAEGQTGKAKDARLRLMKERNELYLAEQRAEAEADEERTHELHFGIAD